MTHVMYLEVARDRGYQHSASVSALSHPHRVLKKIQQEGRLLVSFLNPLTPITACFFGGLVMKFSVLVTSETRRRLKSIRLPRVPWPENGINRAST